MASTGANLSNYAENLLLNWALTTGAASRPTQWFVALFSDTTHPLTSDQPATELNSTTSENYSRQSVTFTSAANGSTKNENMVAFTALGGWDTVTHIAIMDAQTGGNMLFWGAITVPKTLAYEDQLQFAANAITISLD